MTNAGDRLTLNDIFNYAAAHFTYPLKCMLTPRVHSNAGCFRPFHVKVPEGTALNCRKQMAVNPRTRTGWYLAPNVFRVMAEAAPDKVQAHTCLPEAVNIYGRDAEGRIYSDQLFMCGQGASSRKDGKSALLWPTSAANTSGVIRDLDGGVEHDCGIGELVSLKWTDRIVEVIFGGGSGYGDPVERSDVDGARDRTDG